MADPAEQLESRQGPFDQASDALQPMQPSHRLNGEPTIVHFSPGPPESTELASGAEPTRQSVVLKPVFKMKRTGTATMPPATPVRDSNSSWRAMPATSHGPYGAYEPEPAKVFSDILPPSSTPIPHPTQHSEANSAPNGARKTKYATDEERRRATSLALKERWRTGRMDIAVKKRLETMRLRREAAALLGTPGITKPSGPVASLNHTPMSSASPKRSAILSGLAATPPHRARKRSLGPDQLARLTEEKTIPNQSTALTPNSGAHTGTEEAKYLVQPRPTAPDFHMLDIGDSSNRNFSYQQAQPTSASALDDEDDQSADQEWEEEGDDLSMDASSADITERVNGRILDEGSGDGSHLVLAAPDRPYTSWRDDDGSLIKAYGALIPEGYQLSQGTPQHPWICPIRTCRKIFSEIKELGRHFVRLHSGSRLHDNEDGTFSERRQTQLRGGVSKQPAIVVSRGPADSSDPPPIAPSYPTSVLRRRSLDILGPPISESEADADVSLSVTPSHPQLNQSSQPEGDAAALWKYLQPHLVKHKRRNIPTQGWVSQLITLSRVRDLDWHSEWLSRNVFSDTHPRDISALIVQVTGDPAPKPCNRCSDGKGPFRSCIMVSAKANSGPLRNILSCANCFYHFRQTYCSHKLWGAERADRILTARADGIPLGDLHDDALVEEEERHGSLEHDDSHAIAWNGDKSRAETPGTAGNAPAAISEAEPGRLYTMWPDENGELTPTFGALLPAGYQLDTTIPGRPWVCPVRSCRKALCKRGDLGFHFQRVHFAAILNDNGDGTFSTKGVYRSKSVAPGGKILIKAPPIVVSKEPIESNSPIPQPQLPDYLAAAKPSLSAVNDPEMEPMDDTEPESHEMAELWSYIQPHLFSTVSIPSSRVIRHLLTLPRRREIQFNTHRRRSGFVEGKNEDIAAVIVQVTGDEVSSPCSRCRKGKGLFKGCVVVPEQAHPKAKTRYPCCGNCLYKGKRSSCSLLKWVGERDTRATTTLAADDQTPSARDLRPRRSTTQSSFPSASLPRQPTSSALISQGTFPGQNELLEMEDWEIAPGRIRETAGPYPETIAFSKPYLSTPQAVPVCDDVAFRVDTITPGGVLRLEVEANMTRLLSVAAGKVKVKLGDEDEFVVGRHGLFKVKPGVGCTVRNGLYMDAVVHTVVLAGYD
ncbi:hypothetical protein N657DRAFT_615213 [Parathielavia appendiculata]|uniref:C2H2-type domain-containing protein n=1 Tax=Parathielavia appendiculata TaxID=2587402 RepID=A0AAN6Z5H8_9PEZI|nr:hypothetical protein N657DRAFT_615213 [Parathielavia appendiculata]